MGAPGQATKGLHACTIDRASTLFLGPASCQACRVMHPWVVYMSCKPSAGFRVQGAASSGSSTTAQPGTRSAPCIASMPQCHCTFISFASLSDETVAGPQLRSAPFMSTNMDVRRPDPGRLRRRLNELCRMDLALVYGLYVSKCPWVLLSCFIHRLALFLIFVIP